VRSREGGQELEGRGVAEVNQQEQTRAAMTGTMNAVWCSRIVEEARYRGVVRVTVVMGRRPKAPAFSRHQRCDLPVNSKRNRL
jgi:hypothetical protein